MADFVIDTVALIKHLEDDLPPAAARAFKDAEEGRGHLYLPEIAMGEFIYTALRGKTRVSNPVVIVREIIGLLHAASYLSVSSIAPEGWDIFVGLKVRELHDRMIASEALVRKLPLVSNDPAFEDMAGLKTIW